MLNWIRKQFVKILIATGVIGVAFAASVEQPSEPPVVPISIVQQIEGLPVKERAIIKATEIAKLDFVGTYTDSTYGIRVEIQSINDIGGGIEIMVRAWKGVEQLGFGSDGSVDIERFLIWNPPILIADPTGDIVREWVDEDENIRIRRLTEDPLQAVRETLAHTIKIVGKTDGEIVEGKIGRTTSTFFPAAGANSPVDGEVIRNGQDVIWSTLRSGAGNASSDTGAEIDISHVDANATTNQYRGIERGIFLYDTSAIDDADAIDSATLSLYVTVKTNDHSGEASVNSASVIVASTPASDNALVDADYSQLGSTDFGRTQKQADLTLNAYEDVALNSSGLSNISKTGLSKFGATSGWDFDNLDPHNNGIIWASGGMQRIQVSSADVAGTTQDPKLVVEHSVAARRILHISYEWNTYFQYSALSATIPEVIGLKA